MTYADNKWTLTIKDSLDMETTDYCDGAADASTLYFGYVGYEFVRESTPHVSTDKVLVSSDVPFDPFAHGWKIELSGFSDNKLSAVFNGRLQGVNNAFNRLTFYGTVDGTDIPQLSDYSSGYYLYTCQVDMPLSDLVNGHGYSILSGDVIGLYFSDAFGMSLADQHPAQTDYNARNATFRSIKPTDWK